MIEIMLKECVNNVSLETRVTFLLLKGLYLNDGFIFNIKFKIFIKYKKNNKATIWHRL